MNKLNHNICFRIKHLKKDLYIEISADCAKRSKTDTVKSY